jgi:Protein of unknown function (DUF2442)
MNTLEIEDTALRPRAVSFSARDLVVELEDGRSISTPLNWYPKLLLASQDARMNYEISPLGVHWPELDEDLSVAGMLAGRRPK